MEDAERDAAMQAIHFAWLNTMIALKAKGVLDDADMDAIKAECLRLAEAFEAKGSTPLQVNGARVRAWIERLFGFLPRTGQAPPRRP